MSRIYLQNIGVPYPFASSVKRSRQKKRELLVLLDFAWILLYVLGKMPCAAQSHGGNWCCYFPFRESTAFVSFYLVAVLTINPCLV